MRGIDHRTRRPRSDPRRASGARAASSGRSLQEYLRAQLIELAERPDPTAILARIRERKRHMTQGLTPAPSSLVPRRRSPVTTVVDASTVIEALVGVGKRGEWALDILGSGPLAAPHLMPLEAANILRRAALHKDISDEIASMAHQDLADLTIDLFPYQPFATRVWELHRTVTVYDGIYVALAEALDAPLATVDAKLRRASGPRCAFLAPPS